MAAITSIVNETPSRLTLINIDNETMILAPLQEKAVSADSGFDFGDLERNGIVRTREEAPSSVSENLAVAVLGGGFWLAIIASAIARAEPRFGFTAERWPYAVWGFGVFILAAAVGVLIIRGTNSLSLVVRWTMNSVALTVMLAIGFGLPAATIYFFGEGRELLGQASTSGRQLALFARLVQLALITTASLLPVLLFFLFDRYQLSTLRKRLYASLFRLDPAMGSVSEINAKYGSQITEAYGSDSQGRGRLTPGTRWPVLVCAFVMTLGWIVALAPVGKAFNPIDADAVLASLVPRRSAVVFGFLGVYFFSLRVIALRYARGDLKPKAYTNIITRLFVVLVLSWVLEAIFTGTPTTMLVLAFLFGITPDEFFTWLRQAYRGVPRSAIPQPTLPLNDLEGIDLYDLARLESEGIVNIEGLAHHELIDLIIETRIPVPRLVDWIDQAILYLHLIGSNDGEARKTLRSYGIRTATDLMQAWEATAKRGDNEIDGFKKLFGDAQPPHRLEVIRDVLRDDEWFATVSNWRRNESRKDIELHALPSTVSALESMADRELEGKRYLRALRLLKQSLEIQDTAGVRLRIAKLLATVPVPNLRDSRAALEYAARAFELAPEDYAVAVDLIEIYYAVDDLLQAEKMYAIAEKILNSWSDQKLKNAEKKRLEEWHERINARHQLTGVA